MTGKVRVAVLLATGAALLAVSAAPSGTAATAPSLTIASAAIIPGPRPVALDFVVKLSAASSSSVSVAYATANGSAVAGENYTATSGTLTIPAGARSGSIAVPILAAAYTSGGADKSFSIELSDPSGATLGNDSATGTIHADPYLAAVAGSVEDVVIDPSSQVAYISNYSKNQVDVLNLDDGAFSKPINVGSDPEGLDITPDGKYLYVCDSGGQAISEVSIAQHKTIKTIETPEDELSDTAFWIAIGNNGTALFTDTFEGSGYGSHVYLLNLSTDTFTVLSSAGFDDGTVTEDTPLFRSADHSTIVGVLGNDSGGPFFVYTPKTGNVVSGSLNNFIQYAALDARGRVMMIDSEVVDPSTGALLGTINDSFAGVALNPSGKRGYGVGSSAIDVLNVPRYLESNTIPASDATGGSGLIAISPDAQWLVAMTASGATIIRL